MKINIIYPEGTDFNSKKAEHIQSANKIISKISFSNGLIIELEMIDGFVEFHCNRDVEMLPNGDMKIL